MTLKLDADIRFFYSDDKVSEIPSAGDINSNGSALVLDGGFETAVIISIFSNARALPSDELPDSSVTRDGYFGSVLVGTQIGSKVWLLERAKLDETTLRLYEAYVKESLAWMLTDGIAERIDVTAVRGGTNRINFSVKVRRSNKTNVAFKFFINWEKQTAGGF